MADPTVTLIVLAVFCIFIGLAFLIRRRIRTTEHQVTTYRPQIVMTPQMMAPPPPPPQVIVTQPSPTYIVSPVPSPPMMHQPQPMATHIYHPPAHTGQPSSPGYHY